MHSPRRTSRRPVRARALTILVLTLLALVGLSRNAPSQNLGRPPELGAASRDLSADFKLPPLRDQPGGDLAVQLGEMQVGRRARALKLDAHSASDAWTAADEALRVARVRLNATAPDGLRVFTGTRASELNVLLRDPSVRAVKVSSTVLSVDEPVSLRREKVWLDLGGTELRAAGDGPRFMVRVENAPEVFVQGGNFFGGQCGVLVYGSRDVTLRGGRYEGLQGSGVVLKNAPGAVLADASLTHLGGAAVLLNGDTVGAVLIDNEVTGNLGPSNWHAGIVLTDRNSAVEDDPGNLLGSDHYGAVEQPIQTRLHPPRRNVVAFNRVASNASSGIYCDGAVESVIFDNTVEGNSKEGICLDSGSTANVVAMNLFRSNGKRWGKTDEQLRLDFVDKMGRLPDGSSPAKVPGVSMDNAIYNVVYANVIERNYGGGVKMVRSAYFNLLGLNTLIDDNEGVNERFHFFGIELGAAKPDLPVSDLDFTPSRGNIVFGNTIRGPHYAGIFFGPGSTANDVFDNTIFGASAWAMEQVQPQANASLNNLTNLPSRNIGAGIDPNLLNVTKGRPD